MEDNNNTNWNTENENNTEALYSYTYSNVTQESEEKSLEGYSSEGYASEEKSREEKSPYNQGPLQSAAVNGGNNKKEKKPKNNSFGIKMARCTAYALVFGLISGSIFHGTGYLFDYAQKDEAVVERQGATDTKSTQDQASNDVIPITNEGTGQGNSDLSGIVEQVMPSVVSITNVSDVRYSDPFGFGESYSQETQSGGSGIIIGQSDKELYIATNNHVVMNAKSISVQFVDEETITAEVKGTDADTDLAVLSIPVKEIPAETLKKIKVAKLGNSDNLKVGESVIAIGNALGYGQSVTRGVLSALDREVSIADPNSGQYITNDLIQTDAAINPGNSGGALLNMNGEVIGINSVKYASEEVEGMGYAIPISAAQPIIDDLINRRQVDESKTAYLGISGTDVTNDVIEKYGMPEGVFIVSVEERSAAAEAGILKGDIITKFDGKEIKSMAKLQDQLKYYEAGKKVEVTLQRSNNGQFEEQKIMVTLGKKN